MDVRRIAAIKDGDTLTGNRTRVKIAMNKMASPFREAEFDILFGQGICRETDLLDLAATQGVVDKSGSWFSFDGNRIGQGRENARIYLAENPEIFDKIDAQVGTRLGL